MLVRDYGCDLCYTAMYHSRTVVENPEFLNQNFATNENDRPLVVQVFFCFRNITQIYSS